MALALAQIARADKPLDGNWQLINSSSAIESTVSIFKVETKDGKPAATVAFAPPNVEVTVTAFAVTDTTVTLSIRQARMIQNRQILSNVEFIGVRGSDPKVILGSTGSGPDDRIRNRARLVATDKTEMAANELNVRLPLTEPMLALQHLSSAAVTLANKARME